MEKQNTQQPEVYTKYVTVQKFQQVQNTCKGVRKELPRATEIHGTEEG